MILVARLWVIVWVLTVVHTCGPVATPRREPVRAGGSSATFGEELIASTNCVEVGAPVMFTITLTNYTDDSLMLTGTPVMDITLQPTDWRKAGPKPIERWSETAQYPVIEPILAPNERRSYTWTWVANARFAQQGLNDNMVRVRLASGDILRDNTSYTSTGGIDIFLGVGALSLSSGLWPCAKMLQ